MRRLLPAFALLVALTVDAAEPGEGLDCVVEASRTAAIASPVAGILATVEVDTGDRVKTGQVLARLESSVEEALVEEARTRARAQGEVIAAQRRLEYARRKLERMANLRQKKTVSTQEYEDAALEVRLAEAELRMQRERVELSRIILRRAEAELARRTLKSPMDGVITQRHLSPGEFVKEEPVLEIARLDPLKVTAYAPAREFGRIRPGMKAKLSLEGRPGEHEAVVTRVDPMVDASSDLFGIRLDLPNPDLAIPAGLQCRLQFVE